MPAAPQDVLDFWFGAPGSAEHDTSRPLWFKRSAATDAQIRERFGATVETALAGGLDAWAQEPRSTLALIILLDQFTRNIYRDSPRAFAGDERAQRLALVLVDSGADRQLSRHERWFAYMPLLHAEALPLQERAVELFRALAADGLADPLDWAIRHCEVVRRFGRFPHRNETLGRVSTPEEESFLRQPGSRF